MPPEAFLPGDKDIAPFHGESTIEDFVLNTPGYTEAFQTSSTGPNGDLLIGNPYNAPTVRLPPFRSNLPGYDWERPTRAGCAR